MSVFGFINNSALNFLVKEKFRQLIVIPRTNCLEFKITSKLLALLAQQTLPREQTLTVNCVVEVYKKADKMVTNLASFMITNYSNLKPPHL